MVSQARLVRGATRSLVIDLALLLEGQHAYELPEVLIGACRLVRLDLSKAQRLDTSGGELPLRPSARKPAGAAAAAAAPAAVAEE
ncbi:hypothetical protein Rsub_03070 [Raphidocelis subcapitata]|uniref:Protein ENHANCED DISEASE RESISTANCE 2 C-terminal domain-containing protein n=1 Tax=Raphidocelis subcapitata TaxID=307507 RepID=A0A2V0NTX5_9CHLO|nr:hypothetical protein Rsub_03070 [Raphidocelis subcapitata]|eukprot:GBF90769.1 hypothetical protein Rsub_03070 [Raphidocelis subcapitata]